MTSAERTVCMPKIFCDAATTTAILASLSIRDDNYQRNGCDVKRHDQRITIRAEELS
jgi:hypothetical protein